LHHEQRVRQQPYLTFDSVVTVQNRTQGNSTRTIATKKDTPVRLLLLLLLLLLVLLLLWWLLRIAGLSPEGLDKILDAFSGLGDTRLEGKDTALQCWNHDFPRKL